MRSTLHFIVTILITLFAGYQNYQLQQYQNRVGVIEELSQGNLHFAAIQPNCTAKSVVGVNNMNVLIEEIINPISVAMTGIGLETLEVSTDNGKVVSYAGRSLVIQNAKKGKATVTVKGINDMGEICLHRHLFRVKGFPIVPRLGNKTGGIIGKREMSLQRGVVAVASELYGDIRIAVEGFNMTLIREGENHQKVYNEGPGFSSEASELIKQAQVGDFYLFREITVKDLKGEKRIVKNMLFEIQ